MSAPSKLYNALIKTHHITSRKKVAKLKKEAHRHARYVLLRSGGSPGLMYVEGEEAGVRAWVDCVQVSYCLIFCLRLSLVIYLSLLFFYM